MHERFAKAYHRLGSTEGELVENFLLGVIPTLRPLLNEHQAHQPFVFVHLGECHLHFQLCTTAKVPANSGGGGSRLQTDISTTSPS